MPSELTPKYNLNTTNWVKIWFSTDPSHFIAKKIERIETKMTEMVIENEHLNFTVIYSSAILNNSGKNALIHTKKQFTHFPNLSFLDIDSPEFRAELQNKREWALYTIALKELANLGRGGNPAAASDIIRILTPCSRKGIYADFDVPLKKETIEEVISVNSPILFPIARTRYCNDIIAIVPNIPSPLLDTIQQNILDGYSTIGLSRFSRSALDDSADSSHLSSFIDELKRKAHSVEHPETLILELRQFIQLQINECQKRGATSSFNFWRHAYISSVMTITGPKNYELACKGLVTRPFSICATSLSDVVTSQVHSHKNDGSWIPAPNSGSKQKSPYSSEYDLNEARKTQGLFKDRPTDVTPQEANAPNGPEL